MGKICSKASVVQDVPYRSSITYNSHDIDSQFPEIYSLEDIDDPLPEFFV